MSNVVRMAIAAGWLLAAPAAFGAEPVSVSVVRESDTADATVHEVVVPASQREVWTAISNAAGWRTWAAPVAWTDASDPTIIETSYDPNSKPGGDETIKQQIVLAVPERLLAFRTIKAAKGFSHFDALARVTWVFELIAQGSASTKVRLTGSGYPRTPGGTEIRNFFERGNVTALGFLRDRMANGPIDWSARLGEARQAEKAN